MKISQKCIRNIADSEKESQSTTRGMPRCSIQMMETNDIGTAYMLSDKLRPGRCAVNNDEWRPFTATLDSGALEHTVPHKIVNHIKPAAGEKDRLR